MLTGLVRSAAAQAGLPTDGIVAQHTSACLAGADLPSEEADLNRLVASLGWSTTSAVVNDTFAVLRAGLDDGASPHWGIGVVCGAGINCVGVAPDGRTTRFLSLGELSGDWGGGGDLGPLALWWAARAEDGRGPETELRTAVPAYFGMERVEDVVIGIHLGKIPYEDRHRLVPVLFEVASHGDQVARDLLARQAEEICLMAEVAARPAELDRAEHPDRPAQRGRRAAQRGRREAGTSRAGRKPDDGARPAPQRRDIGSAVGADPRLGDPDRRRPAGGRCRAARPRPRGRAAQCRRATARAGPRHLVVAVA